MTKREFTKPIVSKGKVQLSTIVCKKAACSGSSSHSATTYKCAQVITLKKTA